MKIRLPVPGILSIFHRISGVLLILTMPFLVWMFGKSLQNTTGFEQITQLVDNSLLVKLIIVAVLWSIIHHMLAGIRFLLIDAGVGVNKQASTMSSTIILVLSLVSLLGLLVKIIL